MSHHNGNQQSVTVLVLPVEGQPYLTHVDTDWDTIRGIVGGLIQLVPLRFDPGALMYVNENGKNLGLTLNPRATTLAFIPPRSIWRGDVIVGDVVVTSSTNPVIGVEDGEMYDVTNTGVVDLLTARGILVGDRRIR